jgi:hypothetical protein
LRATLGPGYGYGMSEERRPSRCARLAWLWKAAQPFRAREAAVSAPAIALILAVGLALDRPIESAAAAGAAFSVGFGAYRGFAGTRWAAMVGAALGMTAAAFAGSLLGNSLTAFLIAAGAVGAVVAWLALHDENVWWIALQCAIAFFVSGAYAGSWHDAILRAAVVAIGGALQIASVVTLRALVLDGPPLSPSAPPRRPTLLQSHAARAAIRSCWPRLSWIGSDLRTAIGRRLLRFLC